MPKITHEKLERIYSEAESADREVFAEMRSNVLLVAGEHYQRKGYRHLQDRIRSRQDLSETQKLRLTKNLTHKVARRYISNIGGYAPGVTVLPQRENELQDQKDAEINKAVWDDARSRYRLSEKRRQWLRDFVEIGEVCVKLFWDPNAGDLLGYAPKVSDDGVPELDEMGQPVADDDQPIFSGGFIFERVYGMNLLRHVGSNDMRGAECWIVRKMTDIEVLRNRYKGDEQKLKLLTPSAQEDFIVFDSDRASYRREDGQVLVKEYYWRPSAEYPEGYFAISTSEGILEEGPLPFGIFPLVWKGFDEFATTCRGRSIIKVVRPYQAEINRASSAMAMHQVTLGDDKVLYQAGSRLSQGSLLPGVRGIAYAGLPPTVLPGRDGSQYQGYVSGQISELFMAADMDEENEGKQAMASDPYATLFKSLKQQKRYAEYGEKWEEFQVELCELFLLSAKRYYDDSMYIVAAGRAEQVNLEEFRKSSPLSYAIKVEPRDETLETQFGKQLTMNHLLQYVGPNMDKETIGQVVRSMPFANAEEAFSDVTLDYDSVKNDMLQLERGQMPPMSKYDNDEYAVKKLSARMRKPDFRYLLPQVQQLYQARIAMHEQAITEKLRQKAALDSEFIPTGGAMIACDMYITNPEDPTKAAKRIRIPYQALDWLINTLQSQGQGLDQLETQNKGVISEMAGMLLGQRAALPQNSPMTPPTEMGGSALGPLGVS